MAKYKKQKKGVPTVVDPPVATVMPSVSAAPAVAEEKPKKKYYYNPVTAKAYRDRLKEYAKKGGYEPKERKPGSGATEKRQSKAGTTYYYTPWGKLTQEQKESRLAAARKRSAEDREFARKYREEHPEAPETSAAPQSAQG